MNRTSSILVAASFALAMVFTVSCSSGDDVGGDSGGNSSNSTGSTNIFCQTANACVEVSAEACLDLGGSKAASCEISSSSSSSVAGGSGACPDATTVDATDAANGSVTCGGKTYATVKIGNQTWMKKNLDYNVTGSKCYNNEDSNCDTYGRLYDWATAMNIDSKYNSSTFTAQGNHHGICPQGWHIPSNAEWDELYSYADGDEATASPYYSLTAGTKLKASTGWNVYSGVPAGTDEYGFSALPGGYGGSFFYYAGNYGYWWSSDEINSNNAYDRNMGYDYEYADWLYNYKTILYSVRCLQDD